VVSIALVGRPFGIAITNRLLRVLRLVAVGRLLAAVAKVPVAHGGRLQGWSYVLYHGLQDAPVHVRGWPPERNKPHGDLNANTASALIVGRGLVLAGEA
jgi:hypothetical protein